MQSRRCVYALLCLVLLGCSGRIGDRPSSPTSDVDGGDGTPGSRAGAAAAPSGGTGGSGGPAAGGGGTPASYEGSASLARRLSRAELDNTLRDLLGDETAPAQHTLSEDAFAPYDNDYRSQVASSAFADTLEVFAGDVAIRALTTPAQRTKLVPCTTDDVACFETTVSQLVSHAFRRPLANGEVAAYMPLFTLANEPDAVLVNSSAFDTAIALVVRAVVLDPEFLYRVEAGTTLTEHEIAARLSYLLWGTMPDPALRADADAGRLRQPAQRRAAAERLLRDPRAREQLHRFHAMWLGYRAIPHSPELAAAFARETSVLLDRVIFDDWR